MRGLGRILLSRAVQAIMVACVIGSLCFALMRALPGDIAMRVAAGRYGPDGMTAANAERVREELGLDRPWFVQLGEWMSDLFRLDLGHSLVSGASVVEELQVQLGASIGLALAALALSLLIGPAIGVISGLRAGTTIDRANLVASVAIRALPPFVLGLVLMLIFSIWLRWLPPAGFGTLRELALPALTLALGLAALSSRVTRDAVATVTRSSFFGFARTKGLTDRQAVLRHGLRNAAAPVVAYLGIQLVYLIEGIVVVESIFAYPGIGHALVHAIFDRDVPMVQGTALIMGLMFVLLNFLVDALCVWIDPRLRTTA